MLFVVLKFVHILAAILAIGFNAAYGLILGRARHGAMDGREMAFALKTVKVMDDRVANPCYALLGVTGVSRVILQGYSWSYKWIHASLALLVVVAVLGLAFYTPTLRRQIEILEAHGAADPEFARLSTRGAILGGILGVLVIVIVALMVYKPS
jgi:uncharacterized membrane protein